ncbi:MAG TPA: hypothetical protein VGK12_00835 [Actinomycetota bacterium]
MEPPSRAEVGRALRATALGVALGIVLALLREPSRVRRRSPLRRGPD